jgi:hypothetical protein
MRQNRPPATATTRPLIAPKPARHLTIPTPSAMRRNEPNATPATLRAKTAATHAVTATIVRRAKATQFAMAAGALFPIRGPAG